MTLRTSDIFKDSDKINNYAERDYRKLVEKQISLEEVEVLIEENKDEISDDSYSFSDGINVVIAVLTLMSGVLGVKISTISTESTVLWMKILSFLSVFILLIIFVFTFVFLIYKIYFIDNKAILKSRRQALYRYKRMLLEKEK